MITPGRLEKRRAHLDASAVVVERALLARAEAIESELADPGEITTVSGIRSIRHTVAAEFRALAEELHWHG